MLALELSVYFCCSKLCGELYIKNNICWQDKTILNSSYNTNIIFSLKQEVELPYEIRFSKELLSYLLAFLFSFIIFFIHISLYQLSSVPQSCVTLCDPMDGSTPGFPVHYQLLELAQTHVHPIGDVIQPSHPLFSPSSALSLSQHRGLFK